MLITAIAYDVDRDLGSAYNAIAACAHRDDWLCFLDHDAMFTTRTWYPQILGAIAAHHDVGLFGAVTNRIGSPAQVAPGVPTGHDVREHRAFGAAAQAQHGADVVDAAAPLSGVVLVLSRATWERAGGFKPGFFGVDNRMSDDVRALGLRVVIMPGLYVYHWYRGDGVGHKGAPRAARRSDAR